MSEGGLQGKFSAAVVPLDTLALRPGAHVPGGVAEVSRKALRNLVRGTRAPVYVRPVGQGFEIIAGDSEFIAARERKDEAMAVMVGEVDEREALLMRLYEGVRRRDLNAVEEALIIQELTGEHGLTQHEIAVYCDRVQPTVSNKLRLLRLPAEVLDGLKRGRIGERQARALLKLDDQRKQVEEYRRCIRLSISASEMEQICGIARGSVQRRQPRRSPKGAVRDARIFKNAFRSVVKEMQKAGLSVSCEEKNVGKSWEFRVQVKLPEF